MRPRSASKTDDVAKRCRRSINRLAALVLLGMLLPAVVLASEPRLVTWDALVPEALRSSNALNSGSVTIDAQNLPPSLFSPDSGTSSSAVSEPLEMEDWEAINTAISETVVNQRIMIDGYVLPLGLDGIRVVDFLLVPWVGACIHMPTPPPNQIIHVSVPEGIVLDTQFQAVRLEGRLMSVPAQHDLFLVDGQRSISVAYSLEEAAVTGSPAKVIAMSAGDLPTLAKLQIRINSLFTDSMQAIADEGTSSALVFALLISFAYGALHTLGPGHGKSVVISYFVGSGGSMRRGLLMGAQIAVVHVLSAVLIVFLLDLAVRQMTGTAPADFRAIRLGSYALIIVIGAVMLWQAVSALLTQRQATARLRYKNTDDQAHRHEHQHGDSVHSGCSACAAAANANKGKWIAASVGIVPCTGALLVMLFGLANDLIWPAVFMVVAISAGMALSMATIGVIALYGRHIAENRFSRRAGYGNGFDTGARIVGSTCVLTIGTLLFVVTLLYPPVLQTPVSQLAQRHEEDTFSLN